MVDVVLFLCAEGGDTQIDSPFISFNHYVLRLEKRDTSLFAAKIPISMLGF